MAHGVRRWRWLVAVLLVGGLFLLAYRGPLPFIRPLWDAADWGSSWYVRHRMTDRMLAQGTLIGMSHDEVVGMLGAADRPYSNYTLSYCLGVERSWVAIDSEILVIQFDGDDRATRAYIRTD